MKKASFVQYLNQSKYEPMVLYHKIRKMLL
jgi:hypothetical protein